MGSIDGGGARHVLHLKIETRFLFLYLVCHILLLSGAKADKNAHKQSKFFSATDFIQLNDSISKTVYLFIGVFINIFYLNYVFC